MKKEILFSAGILLASTSVFGEELPDSIKQISLEEVIVSSVRASGNQPVSYSNMNTAEIKKNNAARNIPFILETLPSIVAFSEDGSGVGNTSFRIRGTDASRINVTLNGMPLNNPESQEVYWVNLPDLSNSLQSIQVQRGVGTSSNGAASFGANISLKTLGARSQAYGEASTAIGSYKTYSSTIAAGTGILKNGLSLDARYSRVTGDGYIRNGKVDHRSAYAALSYYTENDLLRLSYVKGIQHTGITWEGISPEQLLKDRRYNPAGRYYDDAGNVHYYDNETDNYFSDIFQLTHSRKINSSLSLNSSLSYNKGSGYYENYKVDQKFESKFGLPSQIIDSVEHTFSDIIRQKALSNNFYVLNTSLNHSTEKFNSVFGAMYSVFDGNHYGNLVWSKFNQNIPENYEWYRNDAYKKEFNIFAKTEYKVLEDLSLFGDLQYRYIDYRMKGIDDDFANITNNSYFSFFNPKVGASWRLDKGEIYTSLAVANREPARTDIKESIKGGATRNITSESMVNYELGYKYASSNISFGSNLYYMKYKNQLLQTGRLNDVGYKLMENVPNSYRLGLELVAAYQPAHWFRFDANLTLSQNKIKDYTAYYDVWGYNSKGKFVVVGQESENFSKTNIGFSPNVVSALVANFIPTKDLTISLIGKYVGKQYIDNTSNDERSLDSYFVTNFTTTYTFRTAQFGEIDLQFVVNNIFDTKYVANGTTYTDRYADGSPQTTKISLFPQATRNMMAKMTIRF